MLKLVSLFDLVKLKDNKDISEKYIRYLCGYTVKDQYRHDEIISISKLINILKLSEYEASGFIFGYTIAQLDKEFDLLKISKEVCLNIEIKSHNPGNEKIKKQLMSNYHYLKLVSNIVHEFTYVADSNELYMLDKDNNLVLEKFNTLKDIISFISFDNINLDEIFSAKNILVSPMNNPDKFIADKYILTDQQNVIKKKLFEQITMHQDNYFYAITGEPGAGKTLLLYDIAKELSKEYKILIVHCGLLCDGHRELNDKLKNVKIIPAKELRYREIKDADFVLIDESHRMYLSVLEKADRWVKKTRSICLFSYDPTQQLSYSEINRRTTETIENLCGPNIHKLTGRIRTNKQIILFVKFLFDLSKKREKHVFDNVHIIYEPDKIKADYIAKNMEENDGYTYITYTDSLFNQGLHYQSSKTNSHTVIGQEFEKVVVVLNDNFYYENKILMSKEHPNPDYIFTKLLYQSVTRAKSELTLIVTNRNNLMKILTIFD